MNNLKLVLDVYGELPFTKRHTVLHLFFASSVFNVHLVVFHQVKNFLWIGKIPDPNMESLSSFNVHYGITEEIYDRFDIDSKGLINYPTDIFHFLSQKSTSRYIHCPPERVNWLKENKIALNENKIESSVIAVVSMKSLMKSLQMQFWIVCGTLLGLLIKQHSLSSI